MNNWTKLVAVLLIVTGCGILAPVEQNAYAQVAAKIEKDKITVTVSGKLFTCYKFAATQKYPYFWPVNGPASGKSITTETSQPYPHHHSLFFGCDRVNGPASGKSITTETSQPYPHHHSLFFGCDRVNGGNYWQEGNERGQIVSQGPKLIKASGDHVIFTDKCLWQQPGKEPIIFDYRLISITAPNKDLRCIDFEISLQPLTDIQILKSNHALFSARVVPELSVKSGGTLINAEGKTGEKETWGVPSSWCDYSGTRDGITEGIAILQHPDNRWYPAKWFTRDYGFFSPTPMNWLKDDRLDMAKGEKLILRYRVAVHTGDAKTAGIKEIFKQYK